MNKDTPDKEHGYVNDPFADEPNFDDEQEVGFLALGEHYLNDVQPIEATLKKLEAEKGIGEIIVKSIKSLGQELVNNSELMKLANEYFKILRTVDQNESPTELPKRLESFLNKSPINHFLKEKITDHSLFQQVWAKFIDSVMKYARASQRRDADLSTRTFRVNANDGSDGGTKKGSAGQKNYDLTRWVKLAAKEIIELIPNSLPGGIELSKLNDAINKTQLKLLAEQEDDTRIFALLNWVVETTKKIRTENLKIFDTPETRRVIEKLKKVLEQQTNGLGGTIIYGPPGTGKTELLIAVNKIMGFETRVISIHHFTDIVQLLGEKAMTLSLNAAGNNVNRLTTAKETLSKMDQKEKLAFVKSKYQSGQETWKKLVGFVGDEFLSIADESEVTNEIADELIAKLITQVNSDIVSIGLGMQQGDTEETAWVRGEIIQAFDQGKKVVLDEVEKGGPNSFAGISFLLNITPGQKFMLGDKEYVIPSWAKIDGTANEMDLAPYLHDRFSPNIFYLDYSSPQETLLMSLVWLSDEQGLLTLPESKQEIFVSLVTYIFPEIQKLYPKTIQYPLSNRGIRKFCQMIAHGQSINSAVNELLLKKGALTETTDGLAAIQKILDNIPSLNNQSLSLDNDLENTKKSSILTSPIYRALEHTFELYDSTQGTYSEIPIEASERESLISQASKLEEISRIQIETQTGRSIALESGRGARFITIRDSKGEFVLSVSGKSGADKNVLTNEHNLISADNFGKYVLARSNDTILLFDITRNRSKLINSKQGESQYNISGDGKFLIEKNGQTVNVILIEKFLADSGSSEPIKTTFTDHTGADIACTNIEISPDGSFLLLESNDGTRIIDLANLRLSQKRIFAGKPPTLPETGWRLSAGNSLVHPDKNVARILKH